MRWWEIRCLWVALVLMIMQFSPIVAWLEENRALRLLLEKGIILQREYDQAVEAEQRAKVEAEQHAKQPNGLTKGGLTVKLGGFAEIDFIGDSTRSFEEIIGNRPVLRSDTLGGANSQFQTSPRNSRLIFDVCTPERNNIKTRFYGSLDFLGNEPPVGSPGVSDSTLRTSPGARIFQMYFLVESPAVDVKIGQDWSRFGFMSEHSRGQVSVAATPANMFNRWIQASVSKQGWEPSAAEPENSWPFVRRQ